MNYSLGNMLGGAGALNPDKLALNLQFATDKTLTARRGPTPVFTRASTATHVGPTGLIGHAENLAIYSEQFNFYTESGNIVYEGSNLATAPNGTLTADRIRFTGGTTGSLLRSSTGAFAGSKVITLWVKHVPTSDVVGAAFRLKFGDAVSSDFTATTQWQRFEFVTTDNASSFLGIVAPSTGSTQTFDIWGIQYQRGTFSTEYLPTTTAAVYGARFDHDPITLACKGLLIEESRTNLALQSENHPSATWNKTGVTVASATNTAPNGSTTSNLVSEDSSTGLHRIFQSTAYVTGTSYSISCFLKYAGRQFVAISHPAVTLNNIAIFDIQNGTISLSQSGITSSITAYPNGWYRCVVNGVAATTATQSHIIQGSTTGGTLTGSYTGLNGAAFYIYGSQVEAGAFPTSYIPTTTASVVRSADICSITGASFTSFYNQSEGTLFADATPLAISQLSHVLGINTTGLNNAHSIWKSNSAISGVGLRWVATTTNGSSPQSLISTTTDIATTRSKLSYAYKTDDMVFVANGSLVGTDTSGTMPTSTAMRIGSRDDGTGFYLNGHLASIRYYKKRLANAKLQALTA